MGQLLDKNFIQEYHIAPDNSYIVANVRFKHKDIAKSNGGIWCAKEKKWIFNSFRVENNLTRFINLNDKLCLFKSLEIKKKKHYIEYKYLIDVLDTYNREIHYCEEECIREDYFDKDFEYKFIRGMRYRMDKINRIHNYQIERIIELDKKYESINSEINRYCNQSK